MKLPAYPRTKPSGVEWLGDVPEHWDVKRLRRVLAESLQYGANESAELDDPDLPRYVRITDIHENGTLRPDTFRSLPKDVAAPYLLKDGDLLFARSGATSGKTFLYQSSWGICASAGYLIRARMNQEEAVPAFVKYFTTSTNYWQWLSSVFIQSTIQNVSAEKYADLHLSLPPPAEQRAIAAFLDRETGRVDRLVAKKRELLERLKEKRTALISRTVTRGLPPAAARAAGLPENPPLKPSGIEWLGDIPKHWESAQLRRKAHILDCKHRTVPFIDDGIPLASIREVHGFEVDLTDAKQTSEEEYLTLIEGDRRPRVGDIIYSRNATVGDAALVTTSERFCMGQDVCLIRAPKHHSKYLLYLFRSAPLMEQVESLMIGSTFRRINVGQIHAFWICVSPLPEQAAIAAYLDLETAKLDALVGKVEAAAERLQEYRTALITAAVTGKIDVRAVKR
jgi:type I restriction enzyme S subunit